MNDEAAFVAAIAAAPDDKHLPLIFADWLDDHGDPRGPWIRDYYVRQWMPPTYENPVPKLLQTLVKDKRVSAVRRAAVVIGEPIVPGLIELLKHEKPRVRQQACTCLQKIGPRAKAAVPALLEALGDADYGVRGKAAKALQDIGADETAGTDQLKAALTDDNWKVRRAASKVLGAMGAKGSVLEELVERLDSPDLDDRKDVIESLAQLGTADVVPHLDRAIDDTVVEVRLDAVQALGRLKHASVVPPLCRALKNRAPEVRRVAAEQFGGYSRNVPFTPDAVAALQSALSDKVPEVRSRACGALVQAGSLGAVAVPALVARLADEEPEVRAEAARALGEVGRTDDGARDALVPLIGDPTLNVAYHAIDALGKWARLPASVVPPLLAYVARARAAGGWEYNIGGAFTALGKVEAPPPAVLNAFRAEIRDWNNPYCWAAVNALRALGPAAVPAIPELIALVRAENVHGQVVNALAHIGAPALDRLAEILDGPDEGPRWNVIHRLWDAGAAALPLLPALLRLLRRTDDDWQRGNVAQAIRALGPGAADAIPDLLNVLEQSGRYQPGSNAFQAIMAFGPALAPHLARLVALSRSLVFAEWRGSFAELFAQLAPHAPEAIEPLRELLRGAHAVESDDWNARWAKRSTRVAVVRGLRPLVGLETLTGLHAALIPDLAPLVADPEVEIRRDFVLLLAELGAPAVPLLCSTLTDTDETVRVRSADALAGAGDTSGETVAALVHAVEDREPRVRRTAIDALNKLKANTDAVVAVLSAAVDDDDKKVADRAAIALKKVAPKEPAPAKAKKAPAQAKPKKAPTPTKGKKKPE